MTESMAVAEAAGAGLLERVQRALHDVRLATPAGRVRSVLPTSIEADGPLLPLGAVCEIECPGAAALEAEVVRVQTDRITLMPFAAPQGVVPGAVVRVLDGRGDVPVGAPMLGRAVDGRARAVDGGPPLHCRQRWPLAGEAGSVLDRLGPNRALDTGVRTIDTLLTLGVGQRVGIFAGSGVGKTTLLADLLVHTQADACVLCLVGERGREAHALWEQRLDATARQRCTLVLSTSDQSPVLRARAVQLALAQAEWHRAKGRHVLFVLDSATRYAMALREIGLAAGEPATVRAYTPSVFAALPRLIERCGARKGGGAITALMTVLTETDDADDPLAEVLKALLDGHLVLSRSLAERGHFPALHVPRSISRVLRDVTEARDQALAADVISQLAVVEASQTMIDAGFYSAGANPALDRALKHRPQLLAFLCQPVGQAEPRAQSLARLKQMFESAAV
jgi:flagellum-specific ATP synthase